MLSLLSDLCTKTINTQTLQPDLYARNSVTPGTACRRLSAWPDGAAYAPPGAQRFAGTRTDRQVPDIPVRRLEAVTDRRRGRGPSTAKIRPLVYGRRAQTPP